MTPFLLARETIERLGSWLHSLAGPLLPAVPVPEGNETFRWEFAEATPQALMVGKAVRMVSGIRAALLLADSGYTVDSASVLRLVSDFATEIQAVGEGLRRGKLNEPQQRFVDQYFAPLARTPEEYEKRERDRYVSREQLYKAYYAMGAEASIDVDRLRSLRRFLDYGYDKYVHGAYMTAMELYTGRDHSFMLAGHESERHRDVARTAIAGKLHEVVCAFEMMALVWPNETLRKEISEVRRRIDASSEQGL